jgi:mannose-6-phosphate isomerase-like protein (cupin superfamily)
MTRPTTSPGQVRVRRVRFRSQDDRFPILDADSDVELSQGELFVVPRGVEHCPKADEEAHVLLIEPKGTANTGDAGGERTALERTI